MNIIFEVWGYEVTLLELSSVITSLVAVYLGAIGTRMAWPWWILSSSLYAIFFYQVELFASSFLQIIFILAAIWGLAGWKSTGVEPRYMSPRERVAWTLVLVSIWVVTAPVLAEIGAAASWPDSLLLVASAIAQVVMVLQRNETWILWILIDTFGVWHYLRQELYFTSFLYLIFTIIAVFGLVRWMKIRK
jgi:nicotinamide mononucleotide transporter